jgi:predicted aspartyl protease
MSAISYSESEFPPFPAVQIGLRYLLGTSEPMLAKIDTGATRTIVPKHLLEEAGAIRTGRVASCVSYSGERQSWPIYEVTLRVLDARWPEAAPTTFESILVLGVEGQAEVLLGRDILAAWKLELDGPNSHYSVT